MQSVRQAFELHRARLMTPQQVTARLQEVLREPLRGASAHLHRRLAELRPLLPFAPTHPELLRALLACKSAPYDEEAIRWWQRLADVAGGRPGWQPPKTGGWDDWDGRLLQRLADGEYDKATDAELRFDGLAPVVGLFAAELRWPEAVTAAMREAYRRLLTRCGCDGMFVEMSNELTAPWNLNENALGRVRRSALLEMFAEVAPYVEDARFFCGTQTFLYEVWLVDQQCVVRDHTERVDEDREDVASAILEQVPTDEALRQYAIAACQTTVRVELEAL
ncbi:MAG: hypothetical protein ACTHU0_37700, partial [Kofleriaceae bacterium]